MISSFFPCPLSNGNIFLEVLFVGILSNSYGVSTSLLLTSCGCRFLMELSVDASHSSRRMSFLLVLMTPQRSSGSQIQVWQCHSMGMAHSHGHNLQCNCCHHHCHCYYNHDLIICLFHFLLDLTLCYHCHDFEMELELQSLKLLEVVLN